MSKEKRFTLFWKMCLQFAIVFAFIAGFVALSCYGKYQAGVYFISGIYFIYNKWSDITDHLPEPLTKVRVTITMGLLSIFALGGFDNHIQLNDMGFGFEAVHLLGGIWLIGGTIELIYILYHSLLPLREEKAED